MSTSMIVFVVILAVAALVFLFALRDIFKKKKSKKGKKKEKVKAPKVLAEDEVKINPEKLQKEPRINKKKLQEVANSQAKIEPAFNKEELEKERQEEIKKELEKNKATMGSKSMFGFPNMPPFPFPNRTMSLPMSQGTNSPQPRPGSSRSQRPDAMDATVSATPITYGANQKENEEFIKVLKEKGVIKKEQSFGESLIIKEAVETPASKENMKKKRNKWLQQ